MQGIQFRNLKKLKQLLLILLQHAKQGSFKKWSFLCSTKTYPKETNSTHIPLSYVHQSLQYCNSYLINHIDTIIELLPLQDWMQVKQPVFQVFISISERDNNCHFLKCFAVLWCIAASFPEFWIFLLHIVQIHNLWKLHMQWTNWEEENKTKQDQIK